MKTCFVVVCSCFPSILFLGGSLQLRLCLHPGPCKPTWCSYFLIDLVFASSGLKYYLHSVYNCLTATIITLKSSLLIFCLLFNSCLFAQSLFYVSNWSLFFFIQQTLCILRLHYIWKASTCCCVTSTEVLSANNCGLCMQVSVRLKEFRQTEQSGYKDSPNDFRPWLETLNWHERKALKCIKLFIRCQDFKTGRQSDHKV